MSKELKKLIKWPGRSRRRPAPTDAPVTGANETHNSASPNAPAPQPPLGQNTETHSFTPTPPTIPLSGTEGASALTPGPSDAISHAQTPQVPRPILQPRVSPYGESGIAQATWSGLKALAGALKRCGAEFGPLTSAMEALVVCVERYELTAETQEEYRSLRERLDWYFRCLAETFGQDIPPSMRPSIATLTSDLQQEVDLVELKQNRSRIVGYVQAQKDTDDIMQSYRRIQNLVERLTLNANLNVWMLVDENSTRSRLDRLNPSHAAWYNSKEANAIYRDECTPETRLQVLEQFQVWRKDGSAEKIYWLNGMAGTGKTTLSFTLCKQLKYENKLAANFFCSRLLSTCRDATLIIPTIAYQLANYSYPFRYALSKVLDKHPDAHTRAISEQFETLLAAPFREIRVSFPENAIIVIEALDECENAKEMGRILDLLFDRMDEIPIRFFLTSRPEPEIRERMVRRTGDRRRFELHLHDISEAIVQGDIHKYLEAGLRDAQISPKDLQILVKRSGSLFIYAATIVRYVSAFNFKRSFERLPQVLSAASSSEASEKELDALYNLILLQAVEDSRLEKSERAEMLRILYTIICAREPMTAHTLSTVLGLHGPTSVDTAINPLRSVLNVQPGDEVITTLHKSFSDYLFDQSRSKGFYCNASRHNQFIAHQSFKLIQASQPFNICRLESSYTLDKEVPNISEKVQRYVSRGLIYACQYWSAHVQSAIPSDDLLKEIDDVLSRRLLIWMEILNLAGRLPHGASWLFDIVKWMKKNFPNSAGIDLAMDSYQFVHEYASSPAAQSTPHIYVSALRFWPKANPVFKRYSRYFQNSLFGSPSSSHPSAILPVYTICHRTRSLSLSPDGTLGVSGFETGMIYKWSTLLSDEGTLLSLQNTGPINLLRERLEGHTRAVCSVAYSPDGSRIASGSEDRTVRVWDARTGDTILGPLVAHASAVRSVIYSPDGNRIASGSEDWAVRVWDARNGEAILGPLVGHTSAVCSVAYSPDGNDIASGSEDRTVRVWGTHTRSTIVGPLVGHTGTVYSVAYSPDGNRIASGSEDCTIRVWNATTGGSRLAPLLGHKGAVYSVAYSPNGDFIASGSEDCTVRLWDAATGDSRMAPLLGHKGAVYSVAYSPNGPFIASGSEDRSVRLWDVSTRQQVGMPIGDHQVVHSLRDIPHIDTDPRLCQYAARFWDTRGGQLTYLGTTRPIASHQQATTNDRGEELGTSSDIVCPNCLGLGYRFPSTVCIKDALVTHSGTHVEQSRASAQQVQVDDVDLVSSSIAKAAPKFCSWAFDQDGWIVMCTSQRLLWVPPDVRGRIQHRLDSSSIPIEGTLQLEIQSMLVGKKWTLCYRGSN